MFEIVEGQTDVRVIGILLAQSSRNIILSLILFALLVVNIFLF